MKLHDPYDAGYFAFYSMLPRSANPYLTNGRATPAASFIQWECGWLDAYDCHQEALAQCATSTMFDENETNPETGEKP